MRKHPERPLTITEKSTISKCNKLGDSFIKMGIDFKALALSLTQNEHTPDIKEFVDKRIKLMESFKND